MCDLVFGHDVERRGCQKPRMLSQSRAEAVLMVMISPSFPNHKWYIGRCGCILPARYFHQTVRWITFATGLVQRSIVLLL